MHSGILAYGIGKMNGVGGREGWRWLAYTLCRRSEYHWCVTTRIFIIEGLLTVVVALFAYFLVPTWSHKAKFVRKHIPSGSLLALTLDLQAHAIRKRKTFWTPECRFRRSRHWAFWMDVRPSSIDRSSCLGICFPLSRLCFCPVLFEFVFGKRWILSLSHISSLSPVFSLLSSQIWVS